MMYEKEMDKIEIKEISEEQAKKKNDEEHKF